MRIELVGTRGRIVSFPELSRTNLYLVYGPEHTFLCDTFLGPEPMERVKKMLTADGRTQPVVVFNSHKDWDHIWGNCAFPGSTIVATEQCAVNARSHFAAEWANYGDMAQGDVVPVFPNLLFTGRLLFPDDGVLFISSPGHTNGSASCIDLQDSVLYLGDNVEAPLPYLYSPDLKSYAKTLSTYLSLNPATFVTGHGERETMTLSLVRANLAYVTAMSAGDTLDDPSWDEQTRAIHRQNLEWLAKHR